MGTPVGLLAGAAFTLMLAGACVSDVRSRRIPNRLVVVLAFAGALYAAWTMTPRTGLGHSLGGIAVGLAIWVPFWMVGVLGAGDVKLAAAAGAWLGVGGVVEASLMAAVAGGGLALWALARDGGIGSAMTRFSAWMVASRSTGTLAPELTARERRVPYGLAIATGALVTAWVPTLIW